MYIKLVRGEKMTLKNDTKVTVAMVASVIAVFLLLVQLSGFAVNKQQDFLIGSAIGGSSEEAICLWQMGERNNLVVKPSFCNRLFSRYAGEGTCSGTPGDVEWSDNKGSYKFAYDGYCESTQGGKSVSIYSGVLV